MCCLMIMLKNLEVNYFNLKTYIYIGRVSVTFICLKTLGPEVNIAGLRADMQIKNKNRI